MTNVVDHGTPSGPHEIECQAKVRHKKLGGKDPVGLLEINKCREARSKQGEALKPQK